MNGMEFQVLQMGDEQYEMSVLPCYMSVNPTYTQGDRTLVELGFCDRYDVVYKFYAAYSMTATQITFYPVESDASSDAYALPKEMTFQYEFKYANLVLIGEEARAKLQNEYTVANKGVILHGAAEIGEMYDDIQAVSLQYTDLDNSSCVIAFEDGGRTLDAGIATFYDSDSIAAVTIRWTQEMHPYNGREEVFDENSTLNFDYINSYPYGFIMIKDDQYYSYQSKVPDGAGIASLSAADASDKSMYLITLEADQNLSIKDYTAAVDLLKERLDILTDGEAYTMEIDDYTIELSVPKKCFYGLDVEDVLKCYISREMELYGIEEALLLPEHLKIGREDIESVSLLTGAIEGADKTEIGAESEEYPYFEVVLTDKFASENAAKIAEWGTNFTLALDVTHNSYYYLGTYPAGDGKTFFCVNKDFEGPFQKLMLHNLQSSPLAEAFSYRIRNEIGECTWETPEDALYAGANQKDVGELEGDTVLAVYGITDKWGEYTAGEQLDKMQVLKERLDALGQPYAVGICYDETGVAEKLVIRTGLGHMGLSVMMSLDEYEGKSFSLRSGLVQTAFYNAECTNVQNVDGTVSLQVSFSDEYGEKEKLKSFTEQILEKGQHEIELLMAQSPFAKAEIESGIEDGMIVFDRFLWNGEMALDKESGWMADYFLGLGSEMGTFITYSFYEFSPSFEKELTEKEFGVQKILDEEKIEAQITAKIPDAAVRFNDTGNELFVNIYSEVDKELVARIADKVKTVYEDLDFENSSLDQISLYLIDEDDETMERARIFFYKNYFGDEGGTLDIGGIFCNGRLESYKTEFRKMMENDALFKKYNQDSFRYSLEDG